jgi:hypothetical protein
LTGRQQLRSIVTQTEGLKDVHKRINITIENAMVLVLEVEDYDLLLTGFAKEGNFLRHKTHTHTHTPPPPTTPTQVRHTSLPQLMSLDTTPKKAEIIQKRITCTNSVFNYLNVIISPPVHPDYDLSACNTYCYPEDEFFIRLLNSRKGGKFLKSVLIN